MRHISEWWCNRAFEEYFVVEQTKDNANTQNMNRSNNNKKTGKYGKSSSNNKWKKKLANPESNVTYNYCLPIFFLFGTKCFIVRSLHRYADLSFSLLNFRQKHSATSYVNSCSCFILTTNLFFFFYLERSHMTFLISTT